MKVSDVLGFLKAEAFLLSAIPAVAVAVSFIFEMGYLSFYDAPLAVIEIDIYKVIVSFACLVVLFYWIAEVLAALVEAAGKFSKIIGAFFVSLIPGIIVALFAFLFKFYLILWVAGATVILLYLYLAVELRRKSSESGEGVKSESGALVGRLKEFLLASAVVAGLSFGAGYNIASDKIKYFVVSGDRVLIEMYGDKVVLANVDDQEGVRTLTGEIEVVNLSDFQLKGKSQRLGPLAPAKTLTP